MYTMSQTDRDVLIALYNATGGGDWKARTNWNTDADLSQWRGVKVNNEGRVVELDLCSNNLRGPIPEALGALSKLENLALGDNQLTGHIPPQLGYLSALERLDLYRNELFGPIPPGLGAISNLMVLSLSNNELTGEIPASLGQLVKLETLYLNRNNLSGPIPREMGNLLALRQVDLAGNQLRGAPDGMLRGASLMRWLLYITGEDERYKRPWAISILEYSVALWYFLVPIVDDVTDVILLVTTFEDRGGLWWACCGAFVVAHVERVILLLVALCLVLCWIPFALVDTSRRKFFKVPFKILNGCHDLGLERGGCTASALRWPILDAVTWAVMGSRSKSSPLMRLCGMSGNTSVDVLERTGFRLSLIDRFVDHHPYTAIAGFIFSCPYGHHLPYDKTARRRSAVMLRAVGETLVVDSLFLALPLFSDAWEDGLIGVISLILSVVELLTELQFYAAEAGAFMVTGREETMGTEVVDRDAIESANRVPSL